MREKEPAMTPEQRIDELERQNRRFRRTGVAVLLTVLSALVVCVGLLATSRAGAQGVPKPGVVTGSEFRLVDSSGMTRAVLAMEKGTPWLRFLDETGKSRAIVGLQEYGPSLAFVRENGRPGASIGVGPLGPAMAFGDSGGSVRFMLTVDSTGAPRMVLKDTTGHVAWSTP
jgi:hypothetical protein